MYAELRRAAVTGGLFLFLFRGCTASLPLPAHRAVQQEREAPPTAGAYGYELPVVLLLVSIGANGTASSSSSAPSVCAFWLGPANRRRAS